MAENRAFNFASNAGSTDRVTHRFDGREVHIRDAEQVVSVVVNAEVNQALGHLVSSCHNSSLLLFKQRREIARVVFKDEIDLAIRRRRRHVHMEACDAVHQVRRRVFALKELHATA